jgi:hypothetical protein
MNSAFEIAQFSFPQLKIHPAAAISIAAVVYSEVLAFKNGNIRYIYLRSNRCSSCKVCLLYFK